MFKRFVFVLVFAVSAFGLNGQAPANPQDLSVAKSLENTFSEVADKAGVAVVSISTVHMAKMGGGQGPMGNDEMFRQFFKDFFGDIPEREFQQRGLGSGFVIDADGYILTNQHVISGADKIEVTLSDGRKFPAKVKGQDQRADLAVLKINAKNLKALELDDSDNVRIGQFAIAVGNPFGIAGKPTLTVGVISALNRSLPRTHGDKDYSDLIQTDAAINPGNSGGPLVDIEGKVIGINVAIISTTGGYQGIGFAIPINTAKRVLSDLISGRKVLYGWLGVNVQDLDEDLAKQFGLTETKGVLIARILPGSPAEKGKMKNGDIIKTFDGKPVENVRELLKLVGRAPIGKKVKVVVLRDKRDVALDIEIAQRPEELKEYAEAELGNWRGLEAQELTPASSQKYKVSEKGVVVTNVEPGSPSDEAGLRRGDVILEINKKPIKNIKDYDDAVKSVKGDALVLTSRGYAVVKEEAKEEHKENGQK
ncbi:MAG: Do family serine endopeptidase [Candidatus Omnitrophica bacterium]|nr:Do family serine endopeptidase [Candidatus Omnitrophota bacterium]MDD5310286.1 Do family serine endopeptidase [Candidatus Omnitrophota bacterium]MDD5545831.1 Do family serine endopeptidase [Candidatus Omnitrophota bacterium]